MTECGKCGKPRWWTIYMDGAEAVKAGYAFQNGYCYRRIRENRRKRSDYGDYVGQLEVVRDDAEAHLVCVSYMKSREKINYVLEILRENGFAGIRYTVFSAEDEFEEVDCREEFAGTL